jgi:replicative DNA helicase
MPVFQASNARHEHPDNEHFRRRHITYELIVHIVEGGGDPDPVVVLHTARRRPPTDAPQPGKPVNAKRHHQFAIHLADLYTRTVTPAAARQYAREVLEDAYRRAAGLHGARLVELAQSGTSRCELTDYLTEMRATLAGLWRRAEAAAR